MQLEVGAILEGKITGITKFGAFVELGEGKTGMVHISEVAPTFVKEITDFDDLTDNPIYMSEKETKNAVIRTRRQGDKIFFKDRNITKPLRKAMNEFKIPSELRDKLPLVAVNNEILWCEGINSVQTSYSAEKRKFIIICEQGRTFCA